mmetsp:Transcript_45480/g.110653  ORF Transcript_45480/g.110653 Transcript_45480/m.110653 type:complete len:762 (+) Transcript_45480:21-2306(+)
MTSQRSLNGNKGQIKLNILYTKLRSIEYLALNERSRPKAFHSNPGYTTTIIMSAPPTPTNNENDSVRNTEIWSTRLQRELLAMTTDNASEEAKEDLTGVLPPFCQVKDHHLDIEHGDCHVMCWFDLPPSSTSPAAVDAVNQTTNAAAEAGTESEAPAVEAAAEGEESAEKKTEEGTKDGGEKSAPSDAQQDGDEKANEEEKKDAAAPSSEVVEEASPIIVTLDISLPKKTDGSVDAAAVAYPFMKPIAILTSGSDRFPTGSTIKDGDLVGIEMDWTPSLHLTDALLNIGLKIKECLSQNEPFHPEVPDHTSTDTMKEMMNAAKKLSASVGASVSESIRGFGTGSPSKTEPEEGKKKKGIRIPSLLRGGKKKDKKEKAKVEEKTAPREKSPSEVRIGDEINMLESPWVDCRGVYSCKPIRRPAFAKKAVEEAEKKRKAKEASDSPKAANAGFAGAGAMFKSITKSAKTALEESFLMIIDTHIIELRSNKLNLSTGTITFAIPIEMLAKLKFRRQESISLFFKPAPEDPLIYTCPDSADCVHQIQNVLKRHGVKGKHTNAATHRAINQALHLVQEIQTKELALKHDPSVERVNEIMDLYRQCAERFESAGDARHKEVVTHMRKFLALPLTVSVLEGTYTKPADDEPITSTSGEGVVLPSPGKAKDTPQEGEKTPDSKPGDDKEFHDNMASLLKEAEADLANMSMDAEDDPEIDAMIEETTGGGDTDDAIAGTLRFYSFKTFSPASVTQSLQIITGIVSFCPAT